MGHPDVNKYRSSKNRERQVIVAKLPDEDGGGFSVTVFDAQHARIVHRVVGSENESLEVDKAGAKKARR